MTVSVEKRAHECSYFGKGGGVYTGRKFHSDIRRCYNGACQLGVWSIRTVRPRVHMYLMCESFYLVVMEHIQSKRDHIPGVTAIYFVEPSERNIGLILDVYLLKILLILRILMRSSHLSAQRVVLIGKSCICFIIVIVLSIVEWMI